MTDGRGRSDAARTLGADATAGEVGAADEFQQAATAWRTMHSWDFKGEIEGCE